MRRREQILARRAELIRRCEVQRQDFDTAAEQAARSLWAIDAAIVATRRAASHPLLIAGTLVAVVVVFRPRKLLKFLGWGLSAFVTFRRVVSLARGYLPAARA